MKKVLVMILAAILVFGLSACGRNLEIPNEFTEYFAQRIWEQNTETDMRKPDPQLAQQVEEVPVQPTEAVPAEPMITEPTASIEEDITESAPANLPVNDEEEIEEPVQVEVSETPEPAPVVHTHSYTESTIRPASCTEDGLQRFSCTGCDHFYEQSVSKLGHKYAIQITAPTCKEKGYTTHTCNFCGDSYQDSYTNPVSHTLTTRETKKATCTAVGEKVTSCSKCNYSTTESTPKLGHTYTSKVTAATCEKQGYTTHTCTACGTCYKDSYTGALGHTLTTRETKKATCTAVGEKVTSCSKCNYSTTESTPKLGHTYTSKVTAATCEKQGYTTHTCTNCNTSYKDNYTNALGHSAKSTVTKKATCAAEGQKMTYCTRCDYTRTETIAKLQHDFLNIVKRPTCTEGGYTTHTCNLCGYSYTDAYTDAKSHDLTSVITREATCSKAGEKTVSCSKCNYKATESIPKTAHVTIQATKAATCTADGSVTTTCYFCSYKDVKVIPATGHSFVSSESGSKVKISCAHCKKYGTFTKNDVHIMPVHVYWENGKLFAQCLVVNTYSNTVTNINVDNLTLYNTAGQKIGSGRFGVLKGVTLKSNGCTVWTFQFNADAVSNYGSNLGGGVSWNFSIYSDNVK